MTHDLGNAGCRRKIKKGVEEPGDQQGNVCFPTHAVVDMLRMRETPKWWVWMVYGGWINVRPVARCGRKDQSVWGSKSALMMPLGRPKAL